MNTRFVEGDDTGRLIRCRIGDIRAGITKNGHVETAVKRCRPKVRLRPDP